MFEGYVNYHDPNRDYLEFEKLSRGLALSIPTPAHISFNLVKGPYTQLVVHVKEYKGVEEYDGSFDPRSVDMICKVLHERYSKIC